MRVIAGSARRLLLKTIEGLDTRPTTDRIKETLFNMLQPQIPGCFFLDLFSGSGAIGIEALSRGARKAVFIENNPKAVECIRENLSRTHLEEGALVLESDVIAGLKRLEGRNYRFDLIFMDAAKGQYIHWLEDAVRLLNPEGILLSDNVLQEGELIESRYLVERRNRTIYKRMRDYLYALKHDERLLTSILPLGDGAALSIRQPFGQETSRSKETI
mgnify:CR=1 FL=1